jgi:hypothetical protein
MSSEKRRLNEVNFVDTSILLDAVTSLISTFKQAGYTPPINIQVDKLAFDKLLDEASKLYSSINVKDSIVNQELSIAGIINIVIAVGKENGDNKDHYYFQEQKDQHQTVDTTKEYQELPSLNHDQSQSLSATATKYECVECNAIFDTPAGHRKHHQAFHESIEEPKVTEKAEI